jgi:hypothetical protein
VMRHVIKLYQEAGDHDMSIEWNYNPELQNMIDDVSFSLRKFIAEEMSNKLYRSITPPQNPLRMTAQLIHILRDVREGTISVEDAALEITKNK